MWYGLQPFAEADLSVHPLAEAAWADLFGDETPCHSSLLYGEGEDATSAPASPAAFTATSPLTTITRTTRKT
jgi:hypothetical protein